MSESRVVFEIVVAWLLIHLCHRINLVRPRQSEAESCESLRLASQAALLNPDYRRVNDVLRDYVAVDCILIIPDIG